MLTGGLKLCFQGELNVELQKQCRGWKGAKGLKYQVSNCITGPLPRFCKEQAQLAHLGFSEHLLIHTTEGMKTPGGPCPLLVLPNPTCVSAKLLKITKKLFLF